MMNKKHLSAATFLSLALAAATTPAATFQWNGTTTAWGSGTAWNTAAGGVGNFIGIARPEGNTGGATINTNLVLGGTATE